MIQIYNILHTNDSTIIAFFWTVLIFNDGFYRNIVKISKFGIISEETTAQSERFLDLLTKFYSVLWKFVISFKLYNIKLLLHTT